ncbi:rhamnogalacturonyl hydrolase YesR [Paenibacillus rhizosphaerae]|uniref:Rhamnogalacturonyl hydrolase YesR n=1 Tax=Paenibacillus rhizosphaerae TaxID=297318 RepID=A0A839TQ30_9BACL|nr:glycoside hydrolase family 88 protein [Paenibacillus rhizosphaerae]MBB3126857.1 rhamnogalacturonyl hydrolase YesR [Paenibacillus rhizosphaerae]
MGYVDERNAIGQGGWTTEAQVLATIANRYIGENPPQAPVYRTMNAEGFRRMPDYRYDMNADAKLPNLQEGEFVYAWAKLWADDEDSQPLRISCYSHTRLFINGQLAFESNHRDDVLPDTRSDIRGQLRKGWNSFVLEFEKTATGCGAVFGTGSIKGAPIHFLAPSSERVGQEGWIYTGPVRNRLVPGNVKEVSAQAMDPHIVRLFAGRNIEAFSETETGFAWLPRREWTNDERRAGAFTRILGSGNGLTGMAWAKLDCTRPSYDGTVRLSGNSEGTIRIFADGRLVCEANQDTGRFTAAFPLSIGVHNIIVQSAGRGNVWGFEFDPLEEGSGVRWIKPHPVEGMEGCWLFAGPFQNPPLAEESASVERLLGTGPEATFWRTDQPNMRVRPYTESRLFGRWNYPLGVTLYGLLETGKELGRSDYIDYAAEHIGQCTSIDELVLWDAERHGAPGANHQLALIDSLDDCGSFGATMLRAHKERTLPGAERAAERIARYIMEEQDRLEDGTLYRLRSFSELMVNTIWCDDLYMSVPFLCQYFALTGEKHVLDDAAEQFLLYRKRLYMPEGNIMHHVYNIRFGKPCTVPWGRGNGWVLFSLTELLDVLPDDHPRRSELLRWYRELCGGYAALQDTEGLWHQVLTDPDSYAETSCTSMFVYAFAKGVRQGWLPDAGRFAHAALRGFEALTRHCIDQHGNIYGVCRGSGYSFSPLYYKERLSWLLNDTHGIGIVLLAGIETKRLRTYLATRSEPAKGAAAHAE